MSALVQLETETKSTLSTPQKTFNRLQKKITLLQHELQRVRQELDACMLFCTYHIQPLEQTVVEALQAFVKIMYGHYKNLRGLSKKERRLIKTILLDQIDHIFSFVSPHQADPEICAIVKEFEGFDCNEHATSAFNDMKEEMQEMLQNEGIDVDFSQIEATDDDEDTMRKLLEAVNIARAAFEKESPIKQKTKKQLEKELKAQELETLQKKGLGTIYKQLAKAFHPDLELDPEQKVEKEKLMKSLTVAYDHGDLHTLLSLEMRWMNRSDEHGDAQLKIYNSILKDQVETLQESIDRACLDPQYFSIQQYRMDGVSDKMRFLQEVHCRLNKKARHFCKVVQDLRSGESTNVVRAILLEYPQ